MADFVERDGQVIRVGDRVTLKEEYNADGKPWRNDRTDNPKRDVAFGPRARFAVGTIVAVSNIGKTVAVSWDDPDLVDAMYRTTDCQWAPGWFNVIGHLDFSTPDKIETYLNGRAT